MFQVKALPFVSARMSPQIPSRPCPESPNALGMAQRATTELRRRQRIEAGRRVAALRDLAGLTQTQLAAKVGVAQGTISAVENGSRGLPADVRVKVAEILSVDPSSLDPAATPSLEVEDLRKEAKALPRPATPAMSDPTLKMPGSKLPPGLGGYLERHEDIAKNKRLRWYLENSAFRAEPWVELDDNFWERVAETWRDYLRDLDAGGGAASKGPARKK